jgi:hypothetical protein
MEQVSQQLVETPTHEVCAMKDRRASAESTPTTTMHSSALVTVYHATAQVFRDLERLKGIYTSDGTF